MTASAPGRRRVVLVAAVADNGVIGSAGRIPWHLPDDMRHFRAVTEGHVVVMGRRTFESIGRPLPRRSNVVVTRQPDWSFEGVHTAPSVEAALAMAGGLASEVSTNTDDLEVMVIGGGAVYRAALPLADVQVITEVHLSPPGDAHYPAFERPPWVEVRREPHDGFDFVWWERRRS